MLILAGAGSGKTRTITYKIAHLIEQGVCRPDQVLAVTFTNKAAQEMRTRVEELLKHLSTSPLVCTFHSFSVRVLRRYADLIGYRTDFSICDSDDQKRVIKAVYEELQFTDSQLPMRKARAAISRAKSNNWAPQEYLERSSDLGREEISLIYTAYERFLVRSNAMDFDDLILLTVRLLQKNHEVRQQYGESYSRVLIDEYQDTNRPQYDLIKNLTEVHQNITAVGDEDQSIYGFRGSDIGNILRFEADFPGATIVKLEQNYRSSSKHSGCCQQPRVQQSESERKSPLDRSAGRSANRTVRGARRQDRGNLRFQEDLRASPEGRKGARRFVSNQLPIPTI